MVLGDEGRDTRERLELVETALESTATDANGSDGDIREEGGGWLQGGQR